MAFSDDRKRYLEDQLAKLLTVVNASVQNSAQNDIRISTVGCDPSASCIIAGHILRDLIKAP